MFRSILFSSCFQLKVILIFLVTPRAYQTRYSMLITGSYKHSAILELSLNTKCQDVHVRYTQRYNGQRSDAPELMLNINMEFSRAYTQHFQLYFSFVPKLYAQHKCKYSCAPEPLAQHKNLIDHVFQGPCPTQTFHQSCASGSMPNTNIYIHIYHQQLDYVQYTKQIINFISSGVLDPI